MYFTSIVDINIARETTHILLQLVVTWVPCGPFVCLQCSLAWFVVSTSLLELDRHYITFVMQFVMVSWHGNAFCITGHFVKESSMDSPHKGPVIQSFEFTSVGSLNQLLNKEWGSDLRHHKRHATLLCNIILMKPTSQIEAKIRFPMLCVFHMLADVYIKNWDCTLHRRIDLFQIHLMNESLKSTDVHVFKDVDLVVRLLCQTSYIGTHVIHLHVFARVAATL